MCSKGSLKEIAANRQAKRSRQLEEYHDRLKELEATQQSKWADIVGLSFSELKDSLQASKYTAVDVLHAYQWQTLRAHDRTNCVVEFLDEAEEWAATLDVEYASGKEKPHLFGIPFSVKELLEIRDHDETFGFVHRVDDPIAEEDAVVIRMLKKHGAVPFVRANIPQAMVSFNCSNPVYGLTMHPTHDKRTPGGSSGGDGALLALNGAPFSLGSDGGGSIRIPSSFCGVVGLKPTMTRVSQKGLGCNLPGTVVIGVTWGPMAREVDALVAAMQCALDTDMFIEDPYVNVVPFRNEIYQNTKPLRIGYYDYDGFNDALPVMKRAVNETVEMLRAQGHTLVSWQPPNPELAVKLFCASFLPDGGKELSRMVGRDIKDTYNADFFMLAAMPAWVIRIASYLLSPFFHRLSVMAYAQCRNTDELRAIYGDIMQYRKTVVKDWKKNQLDAVICPPLAHPACSHELPDKCGVGAFYSSMYNVLDFAAGSVPVTKVTEEDQQAVMDEFVPSDYYSKLMQKDFTSNTVGLPVGVQCVALPNHEEVCLRLMKCIETAVKNRNE